MDEFLSQSANRIGVQVGDMVTIQPSVSCVQEQDTELGAVCMDENSVEEVRH